MDRRAGVGATVASAVIFSILLASSLSVYLAAQEDNRLHLTSNAADAIADDSVAFEGAGGTNVLLREQTLLESNVFDCRSAVATVSQDISDLKDVQASANLTLVTTASPALHGPASDNLSMLSPFSGYLEGFVNTALHDRLKGAAATLGVSYAKNETHYVHLPLRLGDMVSDCDQALSDAEGVVSNTTLSECTSSAVYPVIAAAVGLSGSEAAGSGFQFGVHSVIIRTEPCSIDITVGVSQAGVAGPGGNFSVELLGEELAAFES